MEVCDPGTLQHICTAEQHIPDPPRHVSWACRVPMVRPPARLSASDRLVELRIGVPAVPSRRH
eukprot:862916-Prymnesium_polylepis.2